MLNTNLYKTYFRYLNVFQSVEIYISVQLFMINLFWYRYQKC